MNDQLTHFLCWQRFGMACGKKPSEVWASASFWERVTCPECLAARESLGESSEEAAR